jgi:hypothetical protein
VLLRLVLRGFELCRALMRGVGRRRRQTGFLDGVHANGAFVACGPPGFTALAMINLGAHARQMSVRSLAPPPRARR